MRPSLRDQLIASGAIKEHAVPPPNVVPPPRRDPVLGLEGRKPALPVEAPKPTCLVYVCQRTGCGGVHEEPHPDPEVALRRAVEANDMVRVHRCADGALGCCRLIGTNAAKRETVAA